MKIIVGILVVLALGLSAYFAFQERAVAPEAQAPLENLYTSEEHGISFVIPNGYTVTEHEVSATQHTIVLMEETDAMPPENGEGPTAITIDIHKNVQNLSLTAWIEASAVSNFALGPQTYASTTVAETDAVHYAWSGLYEGETTAFIHNDDVLLLSVTHLTPEDAILGVYDSLIASLTIES